MTRIEPSRSSSRTTLGDHRTQPGVIRPSAADPYARGMPARFAHPTDPSAPLVWRVPAWQPTVMMLFVCGVVALNLYLSPNTLVRIVTIGLGALAFIAAIEGLRITWSQTGTASVFAVFCAPTTSTGQISSRSLFGAAGSTGRHFESPEPTGRTQMFLRR